MDYFTLFVLSCIVAACLTSSVTRSPVEILLSNEGTIRIGAELIVYCTSVKTVEGIRWYKKKLDKQYTIAHNTKLMNLFKDTGRYAVKQTNVGPYALHITGIAKADEGTIGCSFGNESAETPVYVLGSVTEVFVDMKAYGSREESYKTPGNVINFPYPQPDFGYTARCHVQATTKDIYIIMKLNGREIAAQRTNIAEDPILTDPLQERISVVHTQISNFKPGASLNGKRLDCIASTPNYRNVEVRNHAVLNVQYKPVGSCSLMQPDDYNGKIIVSCNLAYNPTFMYATWTLQSTGKRYSGYLHKAPNVVTYYISSGEFGASFYITINCSEAMPAEDTATLNVFNRVGSTSLRVGIRRPPPPKPTTPDTRGDNSTTPLVIYQSSDNHTSQTETTVIMGVQSSGDHDDEVFSTEQTSYEEAVSTHTIYQPLPTSSDGGNNKRNSLTAPLRGGGCRLLVTTVQLSLAVLTHLFL